ncbi:Tn7-like element transposition protein TnsE [Chromobacterium alticapitis]|nr:Tn7-like element transposition protein TnsE [Chromobacterium alticapitis]
MHTLSIGLLPLLTLGSRFEKGQLLQYQSAGMTGFATVPDVAKAEELGSDALPAGLYPFGENKGGVQRLLRYQTDIGTLLVPTIELIRFLFVHNKTLANALMQPGSLMTLHRQQDFQQGAPLLLHFSSEMPVRLLNHAFVQEFAWLAYDQSARKSWESVYGFTIGKPYVSFMPPHIPDSSWTFRGVQLGEIWLVLELTHVSGRQLPCQSLSFSHPAMVHRPSVPKGSASIGYKGSTVERRDRQYKVFEGKNCSRTNQHQPVLPISPKGSGFSNLVQIKKIWSSIKPSVAGKGRKKTGDAPSQSVPMVEPASLGQQGANANVLPIDLQLLESVAWSQLGTLESMAKTVQLMATMLPDMRVSMSFCKLPLGGMFSMTERRQRVCLIALFNSKSVRPVVLLDVERSGNHALSTLAISFNKDDDSIEAVIQSVLKGVVSNYGRWSNLVEKDFFDMCNFTRLPRIIPHRDKAFENHHVWKWAVRLCRKLNFPAFVRGRFS